MRIDIGLMIHRQITKSQFIKVILTGGKKAKSSRYVLFR